MTDDIKKKERLYSDDEEAIEEKEDARLLEGGKKEDSTKPSGGICGLCGTQSKILLSGLAVVILVAVGVVIGASFSGRRYKIKTGLHKSDACTKGNIRLPQNVVPVKYRIYLHPNVTDRKFGFSGNVKILIKVKSDTPLVILHTKDLNILQTIVRIARTQDLTNADGFPEVQIKTVEECQHFEQLIIKTRKVLPAGSEYVVHIGFSGTLSSVLQGFYLSSYTTNAGEKRYLATTHFEATGARSAFPCFDEPAMKANFTVILVKDKNHSALSNMPIEQTVQRHQDGLETVFFQESVRMSTYLVAFIVCDFDFVSKVSPKGGVEIRIWAPKEQISQAEYALECAWKILDFYNEFFKVTFPLPKLDLIGIPDFPSGAMENWGLITYRMTSLLYDPKESSASSKQWVTTTIAHEFAHQWFGNLVTMKWWNDLWLNEGFAAFVEFIGGNLVAPEWQMFDQFLLDKVERAMLLDSHLNSHPISVPVKDPAQINEIFDTISYDKGSSIIRMMQDFLGKETFHKGLADYLNKYKYGNAVSDDLWAELTKAHNGTLNVKDIMDTWTLQMGYPVVTAVRHPDNKNIVVATQKHFITDVNTDEEPKPSTFKYTWDVPLTYHFENEKEERKWFYHTEASVNITWKKTSRWLKINNDQIGFYRVNYDDENWDALTEQLKENHLVLSAADRASLLDNAFELARAGEITTVRALNLTAYLKKETEYVPYNTGMGSLGYIGGRLHERPGYKFYEKYIMQIVLPRVKELGWKDTGSHLNKYLRGSVLHSAVGHNDSASVAIARGMFDDWMFHNKSIAPNLRSTVYLAGIKYGDRKIWDFMFQKYMHSPFPAEKNKLMFSLTLSDNPDILQHVLDISLNNDIIKSQDSCAVIQHVAGNKNGRKLAIAFVKKHWDILYARYGNGMTDLTRLIKQVFGGGKTQEDYDDTKEFLTTHTLGTGERAGKQALANIQNHISWLKENEAIASNWFEDNVVRE